MSTETAAPRAGHRLLDTDLAQDVEFLIARALQQSLGASNLALAPTGLRVRSYSVLYLACCGAEPSQRELAEFLSVDPSQIVALVDDLEGRGYVQRRVDPRDARSKILVATAAGRRAYADAEKIVRASRSEFFRALSDAEVDTLRQLLTKVVFSAEAGESGEPGGASDTTVPASAEARSGETP